VCLAWERRSELMNFLYKFTTQKHWRIFFFVNEVSSIEKYTLINTQSAREWDQNLEFSIPDWIRKGLQGKTNWTFFEWRFFRISISYRHRRYFEFNISCSRKKWLFVGPIKGLDSAEGNFLLLPPLKTLKNKYDRTNKIQREVINLPKAY
jgi:hypothetical protein